MHRPTRYTVGLVAVESLEQMSVKMKNVHIFIGNIIHCSRGFQVQTLEKGFVIVQGHSIIAIGEEALLEETKCRLGLNDNCIETVVLRDSQILIPGLIDTHIHAPQYPNIGLGYDKPLLDWLDSYTYKLEKQYKDKKICNTVFNAVVKKTLEHGTTTACYFGSLYEDSTLILADAVIAYGQRALVGKVNMTTLAPDDYVETPEESLLNTKKFIRSIKSKNSRLVKPVITPRFALSMNMDHMKDLAKIAQEEHLHIQTHISENLDEIKLVESIFHDSYANVYQEAGLLTPQTVLAHGVYLSDEELTLLSQKRTAISHCPDSNTCLKSGMCDVKRLRNFGIKVGLGTDVAGGASPSIVKAMKSALDTSVHISFLSEDYTPLNYQDVFYMATLGGAEALALDQEVGNFEIGKEFDALIVDMDVEDSGVDYLITCNPQEILQKFIYLGDDRNILSVYVAGTKIK